MDLCIIVQFIKKNPTKCNNVSKFYYSIFTRSPTCFGRRTAHHQEPKTVLAASGFSYVEGCWACSWWTLSGTPCLVGFFFMNYSNVIYILLPSEGWAGETWDPSNEMTLFLRRSHPSPDRHEVSLSSPVTPSICSTIVRYVCFSLYSTNPQPTPAK